MPLLDYENVPRPRVLTIEDGDDWTVVRVPPTATFKLVQRLVIIAGVALVVAFAAGRGASALVKGRSHWAEWGWILFIVIMFTVAAVHVPQVVRALRSWTAIEASPSHLKVSIYDKTAWYAASWRRDQIASVEAAFGERQWNLRRPRFLRIRAGDGSIEILHDLPASDLQRVAKVLRRRLSLGD